MYRPNTRETAFENSTLPMVVMDPEDYRFLDCNQAAVHIYGFDSVAQTLGKTPTDVSAPTQYDGEPSTEKAKYYIELALTNGQAVFEWRHMRPDGVEWDAEVHLMRFEMGKPLLQFTLLDITERRKAVAALKESESRFRVIFENAGIAFMVIDANEQFIEYNSKALEVFQCTAEDFKMATPWSLSPEYQPDGRLSKDAARELIEAANIHGPQSFNWLHSRMDGTPFEAEVVLSVVQKGEQTVVIGMVTDVSMRKQAEREKEALQEQFIQAQKMEAVGRLAGGVAHDFNNFLGVIIGHLDMVLDEMPPSHPTRTSIDAAFHAAERSAALTRQLLAFARKQTVAPRSLNLNDTVSNMLNMLQGLIGENIEMRWSPAPKLNEVNIDPSQLDQILANLCVNSRDAIGEFGRITIETDNVVLDRTYCRDHTDCAPGNYVKLSVSDNGAGMSPLTISRIFEPFFTTKPRGQGTGLGLSTVYGIVRQNNGGIEVASEEGKGTTINILFPTTARDSHAPKAQLKELAHRGHGETILLVEDDPALCAMEQSMLENLGFSVLAAIRPREAISLADKHRTHIELLVTDVVMPEMNGRELHAALSRIRPDLKCIYVSGYTDDVIADHGILDENVHFLPKPFTMSALSNIVFEVLTEANPDNTVNDKQL